jgi:hypothetical protein
MKLSSIAPETTHRVIVYGGPKVGKTELVGNLSTDFNLLWFDVEHGYATLTKLPLAQQERIEIISLPDTREYPIAIETLLKVFSGGKVSICEQHGKVSCQLCLKAAAPITEVCLNELPADTIVVVDSLTQTAVSCMAHITKGKGDDYRYEFDDYRKQGTLMDKLLSNMQQARYNLCVITHEVEVELEDGRKKIVPCAGTANFSRNTAKYFDHVIYAQVQNKKHAFGSSTVFGTSLVTGSRTDIAIEKEAVPTLLDIFKSNSVRSTAQGTVSNATTIKAAATSTLLKIKAGITS